MVFTIYLHVALSYNLSQVEFYPFLYMTCPDTSMSISSVLVTKVPLFRSLILLFGFIPFEYDLIRFEKVIDGERFSERSSMALMVEWNHDRELIESENNNGVEIIDTLSFQPRIPFTGWILKIIVRLLFAYRHYRISKLYGSYGSNF